jgi:signal transduction histidine kinase
VANEKFDLQKDSLCYSIKHGRDTQCIFRGKENHCPLEKVKKSKKPVILEHIHYDKDNNALNFEVHGFPIFDSEGNVIQMIEYFIDITERNQAEERAKVQREELVQADKMASLGVLVAGIAHEINNPNQFVISNTPLLREAWESVMPILEEYYKENGDFAVAGVNYSEIKAQIPLCVSRIAEGAQRVDQIVTGLRLFSRQDSEEMWNRININFVVKSAITIVSNLIKKSTENFVVYMEEDLPYFKGHFQRLEQVLINLLQNSCQALPDRGKGIYVKTSYDKKKQIVEIEVKDEGIGIPHEDLPKIKNPFFTTKNGLRGIGLGLSIVSTIIEEHRGGLNFVSEVGKGTTATITLHTAENGLIEESTE